MKNTAMKTKVLLLGAAITAFSFSSFAQSGAAALLTAQSASTPVAAVGTAGIVAYVNPAIVSSSPRAMAAQARTVTGTVVDRNPAAECAKTMGGTPKNVAACTEHANMPACRPAALASLK
jgi:hypothetical protein